MNAIADIDWNLLPPFLAALEEGSLSGAARVLGSSQPTVGRQIEALETQLGVTLFTRAPRGLTPTEVALSLAEHARRMRAEAASMSLTAAGSSAEIEGTVRVTASEIVATHILPGILAGLLRDIPKLQIEMVATDRTDNLLLREADIAIRMVEPNQADLIARKLGDFRLGLYAHRDYLSTMKTPPDVTDLGSHILVGYDRSTLIIDGMAQAGLMLTRSDFRLRCDHQVANVAAIRAGAGFGFVMCHLVRNDPDMVELAPGLPIPTLPVWIVAHRELRNSARVRRVFDHLAKELAALTDA